MYNIQINLLLLFCLFLLRSSSKRLAIVGTGAGGSSAAFFARQNHPDIEITVFEQNDRIGGRALSTRFAGIHVELGGSDIHECNELLVKFGEDFGIKRRNSSKKGLIAIWNGSEFVFEESFTWLLTYASTLWRYGFSPFWVKQAASRWIDNWMQLYSDTRPWHSMDEFVERFNFGSVMNSTFSEALIDQVGCSPLYANEIVTGITRGIYNQNATLLSAIAGFVAIAGADTKKLFGYYDNRKVFEKLIEVSNVDLKLNSHVKAIKLHLEVVTEQLDDDINRINLDELQVLWSSSSTVYNVTWLDANGLYHTNDFDALILATPLELTDIEICGIPPLKPREYRFVHVTLCHGVLDHTYFDKDISQVRLILTTQEVMPWTQFSVLHRFEDGSVVVKFFSIEEVSEKELDRIFTKRYDTLKNPIYAYPILKPGVEFPPISISTNLFYVNAFESFVSVMEGSVVAARNVVRLLTEAWKETE